MVCDLQDVGSRWSTEGLTISGFIVLGRDSASLTSSATRLFVEAVQWDLAALLGVSVGQLDMSGPYPAIHGGRLATRLDFSLYQTPGERGLGELYVMALIAPREVDGDNEQASATVDADSVAGGGRGGEAAEEDEEAALLPPPPPPQQREEELTEEEAATATAAAAEQDREQDAKRLHVGGAPLLEGQVTGVSKAPLFRIEGLVVAPAWLTKLHIKVGAGLLGLCCCSTCLVAYVCRLRRQVRQQELFLESHWGLDWGDWGKKLAPATQFKPLESTDIESDGGGDTRLTPPLQLEDSIEVSSTKRGRQQQRGAAEEREESPLLLQSPSPSPQPPPEQPETEPVPDFVVSITLGK